MATNLVPAAGLPLVGAPDSAIGNSAASKSRVNTLHLRLSNQMVKDLRISKTIEIVFGSRPMLRYDDHKVPFDMAPPAPHFRHELYTTDSESNKATFAGLVGHRAVFSKIQDKASTAAAAAQRLKEQVQAYKDDRESNKTTTVVTAAKLNRRTGKLTSLPSASKPLRPTLASLAPPNPAQKSAESIAQKFALAHLLAIRPVTEAVLLKKTGIPRDDLTHQLDKIAELDDGQYSLDKKAYKDLDIWSFPYSDADREQAIDNAIHAFDRQRIPKQDKLWDMLNEPAQRGRGICLSRLNIDPRANRPAADHRRMLSAASNSGALSPNVPSLQPSPMVKATKKPTEKDLQQKRLFSKSSKTTGEVTPARTTDASRKPAEPKKPAAKKSDAKPASAPAVAGQKRKTASQALSADLVVDSDEEAAEAEKDMQQVKRMKKSADDVAKAPPAKPAAALQNKPVASPALKPASATPQTTVRKVPVPKKQEPVVKKTPQPVDKKNRAPANAPHPTAPSPAQRNNYVSSWAESLPSSAPTKSLSRETVAPNSQSSTKSTALKRPSSSDGDSLSKRIKMAQSQSQSHAPFASSPLTSVTSTSDNNEKQRPAVKQADKLDVPKKLSPSPSVSSPRRMDLAEITLAREAALSEYLKLRLDFERQGSRGDKHLQTRISEMLDQYDFLTGEVASRERKPKKDVPIPCNVTFPADSSVYFGREYESRLSEYNRLHDKVSKSSGASASDKSRLWTLHDELKHLEQLQKAAIDSEAKAKRDASLGSSTRSISSASSNASAPLPRKQAIEEYARYHNMYNAWCSLRAELRATPSYPKLPAAKLEEDRKMFAKLSELQTELLASFEEMRKAIARNFKGVARKTASAVLSKSETELLTWKTKSRIYEWCAKYEKMLTEFGEWTVGDMEKLWTEQQELIKNRLKIHRAVALDFGAKDEGSIEGIQLEDVAIKLGGRRT